MFKFLKRAASICIAAACATSAIPASITSFADDTTSITTETDASNGGLEDSYYSSVSPQLINPNATASAKRLMKYLCDNFGKNVITGQQSDSGYESTDVKYIKERTGKYPALIGLDFMEYSKACDADHNTVQNASDDAMEEALKVAGEGGIVSFCWHWRLPDKYLKKSGIWYSSFYPNQLDLSKFNLTKIMNGEDDEGYNILVGDIDYVAQQLKKLQDADIPILFRPLHEPDINAFWWGAFGGETYVKLWKLMYDRIVNVAGVNNLIWIWNGEHDSSYYPGDEYVDILGSDCYNKSETNDYSIRKETMLTSADFSEKPRILAMTETGNLFDIDEAFANNIKWSWFCSWRDEYSASPIGRYNNANDFAIWSKVYNNDKAITLDKLPNLKAYPIDENIPAQSVTINKSQEELIIGDTSYLAPKFSPQNATDIVQWKTSNDKVATVDNKGVVKAVGAGVADITCSINNGKSSVCKVIVDSPNIKNFEYEVLGDNTVKITGYIGSSNEVSVPDTIINKKVAAIGKAFTNNNKITKVTLPNSLTSIEDNAFSGCIKLKEISIPNSVVSIGKEAFANCMALKDIKLGSGIKTIGEKAFYACRHLKELTVPLNTVTVDAQAFDCCSDLKSVTIGKSVKNIGNKAFGYTNDSDEKSNKISGFKIKCYSGSAGEKYAKDNGFAYEFVNVKKPAAVTGLKTSAISFNTIKLTWNKVTGANGYDIYMNGKKIKTVTSTSYTVAKLKSGTTYKFAVKPYAKNGSSTLYGSTSKTLTTSTNPATVNFKLTAGSKKATVKWSKVTGASGYKIYYKTSKNGSWKLLKTVNNKTTSYTKTGLTKGKTYYFTVKAYRTVGGKTYNGGYAAKSVKIK